VSSDLLGIINQQQKDFGDFRAFEKLQQAVKVERLGGAGPAMLQGSREAQETINRSNAQMISVEEQVLQTLRDANVLQREGNIYRKQVVEALTKSRGKVGGEVIPMAIDE